MTKRVPWNKKWNKHDIQVMVDYYEKEGAKCKKRFSVPMQNCTLYKKAKELGLKCDKTLILKQIWDNSEDRKNKLSNAYKNKWRDQSYRDKMSQMSKEKGYQKGHIPWCRGKKGVIPSWNKGKHLSEDHKKKISESTKGRTVSRERRKQISEWSKEFYKDPNNRKKLRQRMKGSTHPVWRGGISKEPYPFEWTNTLKESIKQRDNYTCMSCNKTKNEIKGHLAIHHIDYNKENLNPANLITLCSSCHSKSNYNRDYWTAYFRALISEMPMSSEIVEKP